MIDRLWSNLLHLLLRLTWEQTQTRLRNSSVERFNRPVEEYDDYESQGDGYGYEEEGDEYEDEKEEGEEEAPTKTNELKMILDHRQTVFKRD